MYPNKIRQRGSALVIAVFIIVVMLALVLALARLLTSSSQSVVYEVQRWYSCLHLIAVPPAVWPLAPAIHLVASGCRAATPA